MPATVTKDQLAGACRSLNTMFEHRGSSAWIGFQGRNGYFGLDLYDGSSLNKTLMIGTKRECREYVGAMMEALWLVDEPWVSA